jgi:hypothetical protein
MKTKSKIIIIITCLLVEASLLVGMYCLGKYRRYEGTSKIGNEALDNISTDRTGLVTEDDKDGPPKDIRAARLINELALSYRYLSLSEPSQKNNNL